jgi:hypothetical protein
MVANILKNRKSHVMSGNSGPVRVGRKPSKRSILRGTKTAWIFYCNHRRRELLAENADLCFGDVCKRLAPQWKELSVEQKQPFIDQHLGDKRRYITQLLQLNTEQKKAMKGYKKSKRESKRLKPKAGLSPYMFVVIAQRQSVVGANPLASFQEIGKLLGSLWNSMSLTDRVTYIDQGTHDKARYHAEQARYQQTLHPSVEDPVVTATPPSCLLPEAVETPLLSLLVAPIG